jgi:hypothetical protein
MEGRNKDKEQRKRNKAPKKKHTTRTWKKTVAMLS